MLHYIVSIFILNCSNGHQILLYFILNYFENFYFQSHIILNIMIRTKRSASEKNKNKLFRHSFCKKKKNKQKEILTNCYLKNGKLINHGIPYYYIV